MPSPKTTIPSQGGGEELVGGEAEGGVSITASWEGGWEGGGDARTEALTREVHLSLSLFDLTNL